MKRQENARIDHPDDFKHQIYTIAPVFDWTIDLDQVYGFSTVLIFWGMATSELSIFHKIILQAKRAGFVGDLS